MQHPATAQARYAFRHLVNGLYMEKKVIDSQITDFLTAMQTGEVDQLVILELYAKWEQIKSFYPLLEPHSGANDVEQILVTAVRKFLATKPTYTEA